MFWVCVLPHSNVIQLQGSLFVLLSFFCLLVFVVDDADLFVCLFVCKSCGDVKEVSISVWEM